jgi:integrase
MLSALLGERPLNPDPAPAPDADPRGAETAAGRAHAPPECDDTALAIRILLATAVRSAELYQARWADVDLDGGQWHIPKSKTGAAMDIPLATVVVDWFRELRTLVGSSAYVLLAHSRSRAARHGGDTHLKKDTLREATR